jgi:hypothetical protein
METTQMTTATKTRTRKPAAPKAAGKPVDREAIVIAPTEFYHRKSVLRFGTYRDGTIAIKGICAQTGEPMYQATVNVVGKPLEGCAWFKAYGENQGLVDELIKAGVISLTGHAHPCASGWAFEGRILV